MDVAALAAWLLTTAAGVHLLALLVRDGGLRGQAAKVTRYPLALLGGHPLTSLAGLALWAVYLTTRVRSLAWAAFAVLLVAAFQGFALFTRWLVGRGGRHARTGARTVPGPAILLHGLAAAATLALVFVTALRA